MIKRKVSQEEIEREHRRFDEILAGQLTASEKDMATVKKEVVTDSSNAKNKSEESMQKATVCIDNKFLHEKEPAHDLGDLFKVFFQILESCGHICDNDQVETTRKEVVYLGNAKECHQLLDEKATAALLAFSKQGMRYLQDINMTNSKDEKAHFREIKPLPTEPAECKQQTIKKRHLQTCGEGTGNQSPATKKQSLSKTDTAKLPITSHEQFMIAVGQGWKVEYSKTRKAHYLYHPETSQSVWNVIEIASKAQM